MTPRRLVAIAAIYVIAAVAWFVLGTSVVARSGEFDDRLSHEVARLWGGPHLQRAPDVWYERPGTVTEKVQRPDAAGKTITEDVTRSVIERVPVALDATRADVALSLQHRMKGLLWYDTYGVVFRAEYRARNPLAEPREIAAHLTFPAEHVQLDNFVFRVNGRDAAPAGDLSQGATARVTVPAGGDLTIEVAYGARGLDTWTYAFAGQGPAQVRDFTMTMRTDFAAIDFPGGSTSPTSSERTADGWTLGWRFERVLTGQVIAMDLPNRLNPGPFAARVTYFAPVSLLFFLTVMVIIGILRSQNLHPMNYAFISAAFFAVHLLLAYLVDHVAIHLAFAAASATSIALVTSYLVVVAGARFAIFRAGLAQLVFLVLFSYAFFLEGFTGLTVTIGAIVALFVLMQATARVDWTRAFAGGGARAGGAS
jgi:hypothetical protein